MKPGFDIRDQGPDNVCQKRDHKEGEHDQKNDVIISLAGSGSCCHGFFL